MHDGEEKREDKLTELNSVWNQQEKVSDSTAKREEEVNKNFPKLIEKETKAKALRASSQTRKWRFNALLRSTSLHLGYKSTTLKWIWKKKEGYLRVTLESRLHNWLRRRVQSAKKY